jgi:hypothetical protein
MKPKDSFLSFHLLHLLLPHYDLSPFLDFRQSVRENEQKEAGQKDRSRCANNAKISE